MDDLAPFRRWFQAEDGWRAASAAKARSEIPSMLVKPPIDMATLQTQAIRVSAAALDKPLSGPRRHDRDASTAESTCATLCRTWKKPPASAISGVPFQFEVPALCEAEELFPGEVAGMVGVVGIAPCWGLENWPLLEMAGIIVRLSLPWMSTNWI